MESTVEGLSEVSQELILAGVDVNLPDAKGVSPLMYAAFYCRVDTLIQLLQSGANVNAQDSDGESALMDAAANCTDGEITAILIRAGAKVNLRDSGGDTALLLAARQGDEFAVKELVAAGADVSVKNDDGESPIAIAHELVVGRKPSHDRIYSLLARLTSKGPDAVSND